MTSFQFGTNRSLRTLGNEGQMDGMDDDTLQYEEESIQDDDRSQGSSPTSTEHRQQRFRSVLNYWRCREADAPPEYLRYFKHAIDVNANKPPTELSATSSSPSPPWFDTSSNCDDDTVHHHSSTSITPSTVTTTLGSIASSNTTFETTRQHPNMTTATTTTTITLPKARALANKDNRRVACPARGHLLADSISSGLSVAAAARRRRLQKVRENQGGRPKDFPGGGDGGFGSGDWVRAMPMMKKIPAQSPAFVRPAKMYFWRVLVLLSAFALLAFFTGPFSLRYPPLVLRPWEYLFPASPPSSSFFFPKSSSSSKESQSAWSALTSPFPDPSGPSGPSGPSFSGSLFEPPTEGEDWCEWECFKHIFN